MPMFRLQTESGRHPPRIIEKEVCVLEEAQHPEVRNNTHHQEHLPFRLGFSLLEANSDEVVDYGRQKNQKAAGDAPAHVEYVAGHQKEPLLRGKIPQACADHHDDREKNQELEVSENHSDDWFELSIADNWLINASVALLLPLGFMCTKSE